MTATTAFRTEELPVWPRYRASLPADITGKTAWTHSIMSPANQPSTAQPLSPTPFPDATDTSGANAPSPQRPECATATGTRAIALLTAEQTVVNTQLTAIAALLAAPTTTTTTVAPTSGTVAGGTAVTLTGTGYAAPATVTFNGVPATSVVVASATSITCVAPKGVLAGVVGIVVMVPNGFSHKSAAYTYTAAAATVATCAPAVGLAAGGTNVTLTGTGLGGTSGVTFGGTAATNVVVVSNTTITCTTPAHAAGAVNVVATNAAGNGTLTGGFTYQ